MICVGGEMVVMGSQNPALSPLSNRLERKGKIGIFAVYLLISLFLVGQLTDGPKCYIFYKLGSTV